MADVKGMMRRSEELLNEIERLWAEASLESASAAGGVSAALSDDSDDLELLVAAQRLASHASNRWRDIAAKSEELVQLLEQIRTAPYDADNRGGALKG